MVGKVQYFYIAIYGNNKPLFPVTQTGEFEVLLNSLYKNFMGTDQIRDSYCPVQIIMQANS